jgi:hypothetical protein
MPSDINNGPAENPSLLQRNMGLLDLFQRIPVGHQLPAETSLSAMGLYES